MAPKENLILMSEYNTKSYPPASSSLSELKRALASIKPSFPPTTIGNVCRASPEKSTVHRVFSSIYVPRLANVIVLQR